MSNSLFLRSLGSFVVYPMRVKKKKQIVLLEVCGLFWTFLEVIVFDF